MPNLQVVESSTTSARRTSQDHRPECDLLHTECDDGDIMNRAVCGGDHYERGRHVQQTQPTPTGESHYRRVRLRRRDARWGRRGSAVDTDLNQPGLLQSAHMPTHPGRPEHY